LDAVKNHKVPSSDALRWGMGLAQDKHIKDPMKRQFIDTNLTNGQAASFAFDFIPFLGGAKAADEARTGKQYFTGKKLDVSDRAISAASVLGGGFVKWTGKGAKAVLKGKPLSEQTHLKWNKKTGEVKQHTPKKTKGTVNVGKIANEITQTIKAVRAQQCKVIRSVENGEVALKTTKRKGNYGEMKMDDFFESQTYTRISDDRVLTLDQKIVKGIDGVYENLSPPPKYVIAEAKYNTSRLSNTKDGKQMSESWVDGSRRLESAVGEEMADRIREEMLLNPDNVQSILINVDKYGNVVKNILDSSGKKIIE
ncbi:pre-toxin TG domain-containing protein, partial [Priestia filamentosa]